MGALYAAGVRRGARIAEGCAGVRVPAAREPHDQGRISVIAVFCCI